MCADTIGPVTIVGISSFNRSGNGVKMNGWYITDSTLEVLRELFRRSVGSVSSGVLLGGEETWYDPTPDSVLTQKCAWDSSKAKGGWYALRGFSEDPYVDSSYWPFTIELLYLGADELIQRAVEICMPDEAASDWVI